MTPLVVYAFYDGMDRGGRISCHIRCKIVLRRPKGYFTFVQNDKHSVLLFSFIGDGDSLCDAYRQQYATLIHHNPDQETNDQTKAVHYLHAQGMRRIAIVGATGKREDHTIGNLSLLIEYMRLGMEVRTYTDYGVFVPCRGHIETQSACFYNQRIAQIKQIPVTVDVPIRRT